MTMVFILAGLIVTNLICAALLFEGIVNDFGDGTIYVMFSSGGSERSGFETVGRIHRLRHRLPFREM